MYPWRRTLSGAAILAVLGACTNSGSGSLALESRSVTDFHVIVLETSGDVLVRVTGEESIRIEAEDNLLPMLTTDVVDGRLELGSTGSFTTTEPITYTITVADLTGVEISGSGDVDVRGLHSDRFSAVISGSGSIDPWGTAELLDVSVEGSGNYMGASLEAVDGEVTISGSGRAVVNVSSELSVTIDGSGWVEYLGTPQLSQEINGSGAIERLSSEN